MKMNNKAKNIFLYLLLFLSILFSLLSFVVYYIHKNTEYSFLFNLFGLHIKPINIFFTLFFIVTIWAIMGLILAWKKTARKLVKVFIVIGYILIVLSYIFAGFIYILSSDTEYYEFNSDNGKHTVVVEESLFLTSSSLSFYERKNAFMIDKLYINTSLHDPFKPIESAEYWLKWEEESLTFFINSGYKDKWNKINIDFRNNSKIEESLIHEDGRPYEEKAQKREKNSSALKREKNSYEIRKERTSQEKLDRFDMTRAIKVKNSDYGIVEVDRAMARSLWYFVEIQGQRMKFISTLPNTSPKVRGRLDVNGTIILEFEDVNGHIVEYKSGDGGYTWKLK